MNLRNQLMCGLYSTSPIPGERVPEAHNDVVKERVEVLTVADDGYRQQARKRYRFLAQFDKVHFIRVSNSYPSIVTPEPPFKVQSRRIGDSCSYDFNLEAGPMCCSEVDKLKLVVRPESIIKKGQRISKTTRALHERTSHEAFQGFILGRQPNALWSFRDLVFFELPRKERNGTSVEFAPSAVERMEF